MTATTEIRPDVSEVLQSVIARRGYRVLDQTALDAATAAAPLAMVFLAGDWWRLGESDDVAAVLPELEKALAGHCAILVAARGDERALQRRWHFKTYPALVFLREGQYLGAIEGIRDWSDYLVEIPEILGREPASPPPFQMRSGCGSA
ncbi:MAG: hydrogenase-1 expression HyaE [Pseudomonadota bacterium]